MTEKFKYLSPEWRDEAERKLREELTREMMNNATVSLSSTYLNCPDGTNKFTFMKFADGELQSYLLGEGEAPAADFQVIAEYPVFVQMAKGEITGQSAMMSGKLKLKGSILVAMKFGGVSEKVTKIIASIPTEY